MTTGTRTQVAETFARLLDAYAAYFQAVRRAYERIGFFDWSSANGTAAATLA